MRIMSRAEFHEGRVREEQLLRAVARGDVSREEFGRRNREFVELWDSAGDSYTSLVTLANGLVNDGKLDDSSAERILTSLACQTRVLEAYGVSREKFRLLYYGSRMDGVHAVGLVAYSCPGEWDAVQIRSLHDAMASMFKPKVPETAQPELEVLAYAAPVQPTTQPDAEKEKAA